MPRWTYRVTDVRSGRLVHEHVPFSQVRFSDSLDDGGKFTGMYPVGHAAMPILPGDCIWKLMVWPCRDGEPQGAYIITNVQGDLREPAVTVMADRFDMILNRREVYHNLNFTNVEQLDIARDLIRYAQGVTPLFAVTGDSMKVVKQLPWLRAGTAVSTVNRTIVVDSTSPTDEGYGATKGLFIGPMLKDLADRSPSALVGFNIGFEMRGDYGYSDGMFWAQITFGWPMVGRSATSTRKVVLEYPSQAVPSCQYGADGTGYANRWRVVGKERDNVRPTGVALNQPHLDFGYPLVDRNVTSGAITESNALGDRAASQLAKKGRVASAWGIELNADDTVEPAWGTYRIGDHVILRAKWGETQMPDQVLRITGFDVAPSATGESETIVPTLMDP